jgi:hypothetical protein
MSNTVQLPKPKLVVTSPQIYKDNQTMFAITQTTTRPLQHYNNIFINFLPINCTYPYSLILTDESLDITTLIESTTASAANEVPRILLATNNIINKYNELNKLPIVHLDIIHAHFQFFSEPWNGTWEDALVMFTIIHQYNRILSDCQLNVNNISQSRIELLQKLSIKLSSHPLVEDEFWLFTQYYVPKQKERYEEIQQTLELNIANSLINKIVLFFEDSAQYEQFQQKNNHALAKIKCILINKRLTYADFFRFVASDEVPANTIVALANSDIYFDDTIKHLWKISFEDRCLALLRYEHSPAGTSHAHILGPRADSQDTWIFNSNSIKSRATTKWTDETYNTFNYFLGTPGCDNSFITDIVKERFTVVNPAGSIKTYHIHGSNIRSYTVKDLVYRPVYVGITPTVLLDKNVVKTFTMKPIISVPYTSSINLKSNTDARVTTYVTMLARGNRYKWAPPPAKNGYQTDLKIYKFNGYNYVSQHGFIFNYSNIYLGNAPLESVFLGIDYFKGIYLNTYGQYIRKQNFLAIPVRTLDIFKDKYNFIIHYVVPLIRCIYELHKSGLTESVTVFWSKEFIDIANLLKIPLKLDILFWEEKINVYSEEIYTIPGGYSEPSEENIACFREALVNYPEVPSKRLIYLAANDILSMDFGESLAAMVKNLGWDLDVYDENNPPSHAAFEGAGGVIFWGEPDKINRCNKLWALPKGAAMLEFQNEFKLDGEAQVMGAACKLDTRIYILQKADANYLQKLMGEYIMEYLQNLALKVDDL